MVVVVLSFRVLASGCLTTLYVTLAGSTYPLCAPVDTASHLNCRPLSSVRFSERPLTVAGASLPIHSEVAARSLSPFAFDVVTTILQRPSGRVASSCTVLPAAAVPSFFWSPRYTLYLMLPLSVSPPFVAEGMVKLTFPVVLPLLKLAFRSLTFAGAPLSTCGRM